MTRPAWMVEGARVEGGEGEDHDTGRIAEIDGDQVTVAWDSEVVTTQHWSAIDGPEVSRS